MAAENSPKKLQRSIWNQTVPSSPPADSSVPELTLSLRKLSLSPPPLPSSPSSPQSRLLSAILVQTQPHSTSITTLDLSYSLLDPHTLATLCSRCSRLQSLAAVDCGLPDTLPDTQWPLRLHTVNLSRNTLHQIPHGFENLLYLKELNLSGNQIDTVTPAVLKLPNLEKLHLLSNPIKNIPKAICRHGVQAMRHFLQIHPLPSPTRDLSGGAPTSRSTCMRRLSLEDGRNLRYHLPQMRMESLESGYDSGTRLLSTASSCSSDSEMERDIQDGPRPMPASWPDIAPTDLPQGYKEVSTSCDSLCQLYLPADTSTPIHIEEVKDLSLHPQLASNELLITPVVQISPHGMKFHKDKPAIVLLCHCTRPSGVVGEEITVLCSDTGPCQLQQWRRLSERTCEMFRSCVKFSTSHFSLFAVISTLPYHSTELVINFNEGGSLTLPEVCPGFKVTLPVGCLMTERERETITATVYYSDSPCHSDSSNQEEAALASPVVGLEPHGMHFSQPVEVTLPVPGYTAIREAFPNTSLQVWTAPHNSLCWSHLVDAELTLNCTGGQYTATFSVYHFSFFELLWDTCKDTLVRLGCGAAVVYRNMRTRYVAVRCQVFMTPPLHDLSFALLVVVYKFGERLCELGNYPWMLTDSGSRRVFLTTGELEATLDGCFTPREEYGEPSLSQSQTLNFTGQDFSLHFAFSLKLNLQHPPLADYQVIGKLRLKQRSSTVMQLNLIRPASSSRDVSSTPLDLTHTAPHRPPHHMVLTPPQSPTQVLHNEEDPVVIESHLVPSGPRRADKRRAPLSQNQHHQQSRSKRKLQMKEDGYMTDKLLLQIAKSVGSKYEELGIALGLQSVTVSSVAGVAGEGRPEHMKAFYVLQEWKRVAAENFTFETLIAALEEAGFNSCARETCYAIPLEPDTED